MPKRCDYRVSLLDREGLGIYFEILLEDLAWQSGMTTAIVDRARGLDFKVGGTKT
jgi:hypothetical protein